MRLLSYIIFLIALLVGITEAQSPHGDGLKLDCSLCHNSNNWRVDKETIAFKHSMTRFTLVGQHQTVDCKSCHTSLVFSKAESDCNSCHVDIHQETVGLNCSECHTPKSWMVEDINGLHQKSRFPLVGKHLIADCVSCHPRYVDLYFEVLSIDCYSCHEVDYNSTAAPNHTEAGFSTECEDCHAINADSWSVSSIVHDFFPLVGGHAIQDCFSCHEQGGDFTGLSQECLSCHEQDYNTVEDPNHVQNNFPTDCTQCHSIFGWKPATLDHNQTNFPLTGAHRAVDCSSCHSSGYTGTPTECFSCHEQDYNTAEDPNHVQSNFPTDCTQCHSTFGWKPATLDHNQTNFPLTGAHQAVDCSSCHSSGYTGTPTECYSCHQQDYESVMDPNHITNSYAIDCTQCHNTSDWSTTNFDHNLTAFELTGAHITVDCSSCHQIGYKGTSTDCVTCHTNEYNNSVNPNHQAAGFPTSCDDCHSTSAWSPANFDHDGQYFPIYTGKHTGKWNLCVDCHNVPGDYSVFSCITCHEHNQIDMDDKHSGIDGYSYESNACFSCHPTGEKEGSFNHALSNFPLTGSHTTVACIGCHENGYSNTPIDCVACHQQNYDQSTNPNHQALLLPTDCNSCHTTDPNWQPTTFTIHDQFYILEGSHQQIANDCSSCHNGDYNNTSAQCLSCHQSEYNSAPNHVVQSFPTNCEMCHNFNVWTETSFDHANTNFPLTGAHQSVDCSFCHESGYTGTSTVCFDCHQSVYQQTTNPDHVAIAVPTDCETCHTTNPNWQPATFSIHDQIYQLIGAHSNISNNCATCHNGDYNNTPNTCFGCHANDYNGTSDPPHQTLNFSMDCLECHNQSSWLPANFDHNFYPLSGNHRNRNCNECHSEPGYQPQCLDCHQNKFQDGHRTGDPTDCWNCHTTSNWDTGNGPFKLKRTY